MNNKRAIRTVLLLFSLSLPFVAVSLWFQGQLYATKQNAEEIFSNGLAVEDVVEIKMSLDDAERSLEWEHDREFALEGEMYDVLKTKVVGDTIIYHCYHDTFESEVKRAYTSMLISFAKRNQQDNNHEQHTSSFFKSLFASSTNRDAGLNYCIACDKIPDRYPNLYTDFIPGKISPPPRFHG